MRMAHAADNLRAIGLDLHAPAAAKTLLAAPQFAIDGFQGNRNSAGKPGERGHQAFAVRFAGGFKTKHETIYGNNNRKAGRGLSSC